MWRRKKKWFSIWSVFEPEFRVVIHPCKMNRKHRITRLISCIRFCGCSLFLMQCMSNKITIAAVSKWLHFGWILYLGWGFYRADARLQKEYYFLDIDDAWWRQWKNEKYIIKVIINVYRSFPIWYCGMRLNHLRQKTKKENGVQLVFQCFKFI